jgi:hypothetical protein
VLDSDPVLRAPEVVLAHGPTVPRSDRRARIGRVSAPLRCSDMTGSSGTVATLQSTGFYSQRA